MSDQNLNDQKHLQLGTDLTRDDRTEISDEGKNALWADACTVEEFAEQLEALKDEDPLVQWELARARHDGELA